MMHRYWFLMISFCILSAGTFAQSLDVHFNEFGFIDNREYQAFVHRSNTIFANRVSLDLGLSADSVNHFRVGANGIHEFGASPFFLKVNPVIYYNYTSRGWQFNIGAFPRTGLLDNYPIALLNDTLNYYRPNVEGILAKYENVHLSQTIWIDWVSRQTATARENFIFGFSGRYRPSLKGAFYIAHYLMMLHDAFAGVQAVNDHIRDNGGGQLRLGLDLSHRTVFDSLRIEAGGMISLERTRGEGGFNIPKGLVADLYLGYKRFSLSDQFYSGQGHTIFYGDSFYTKKLYNRIDLSWAPFLYRRLQGKFIFSFHQSPHRAGDSQQAFLLTYDLGRKTILSFK